MFGYDSGAINGTQEGLRHTSCLTEAHTIGLPVTYGAYALFAVLSYVFVHRSVHETKGLELEQMRG